MQFANDAAAAIMDAAYRELKWDEETGERFLERAAELAALDGCDRIHELHALQAVGERDPDTGR